MSLSLYKKVFFLRKRSFAYPKVLLTDLIVEEAHREALTGNFGINKSLVILKEYFYLFDEWGCPLRVPLAI